MKKCYKCQKIYIEPEGPGFQDVCEGCGSYLHCCQNCYFHDPYQHNSCTETQAEFVSDSNGMNHCEYFKFKAEGGSQGKDDDREARRFKKPDWRNVSQNADSKPRKRSGSAFGGSGGGGGGGNSRGRSRDPLQSGSGGGERAKKAREALDKLFRKD